MINKILFLLFISTNIFGQKTFNNESKDSIYKVEKDWVSLNESNYSIQYPSSWTLDTTGMMRTSFILFSPKESNKDKFQENLSLIIQSLTGKNIDLDKYTEISENQIKKYLKNSEIIESKRMVTTKGTTHKLVYTSDNGALRLKYEQLFFIKDERAFIFSFTSEENKFDDFQNIAEKIIDSFNLKM